MRLMQIMGLARLCLDLVTFLLRFLPVEEHPEAPTLTKVKRHLSDAVQGIARC